MSTEENAALPVPVEDVPSKTAASWVRPVIGLLAGVVLVTLGLVFRKDVQGHLESFLTWTRGINPIAGPVIVAGIYVLACLLFLPGSILTLGAGFLFGVWKGTLVVSIGSTVGASLAFLVGRFLARGWIAKKVAGNPKFAAIDKAVEREGFKIVFLLRLSPVFPFNMLNFGLGLTRVKFWHYMLASWIGMLPGTIMYVYLGSGMSSLAEGISGTSGGSLGQKIMFWAGMAVTLLVTIFVTRVARKALKNAVGENSEAAPAADAPAE